MLVKQIFLIKFHINAFQLSLQFSLFDWINLDRWDSWYADFLSSSFKAENI